MEKVQAETIRPAHASRRHRLLARLSTPIFWILTVCISLLAGVLLFLIFGVVATALNAPDAVIFLAALFGFVAGLVATLTYFKRWLGRGRQSQRSGAITDGPRPVSTLKPTREPFFGKPRALSRTASDGRPARELAQAAPREGQSSAIPNAQLRKLLPIGVVVGIVVAALNLSGKAGGSAGGVDGVLGLVGSAVCNTLAAIGAQSFMPEACPYNPVKAAHHLIVVFGAIFLIEELFRRFGSTSKNDTPSGT